MHIPADQLHGAICPVTAAVSLLVVSVTVYALFKSKERPSVKQFVFTTLTVFALQMLNYPIGGGISGHIIGGVLAASLLGIPAGVLSLTAVLVVQALALGDGGVLELGANVLNMAVVGAGIGGIIHQLLSKKFSQQVSLFAASTLSILLAVSFLSAELLIGGPDVSITNLFIYHLPIAGIEGAGTILLYDVLNANVRYRTAISIAVVILLFAAVPFASASPDALETVLHI